MISTVFAQPFEPLGCAACRDKTQLPSDFTMAFQPIMDLHSGRPFAYEALVRGVDGQSAATVLSWVDDAHRYRFDQACRVKAIELASRLGLAALPQCRLSINFLFLMICKFCQVNIRKICPTEGLVIGFHITQKIYFLKCSA